MPGESSLLRPAIGVITKAALLLEMENECPYLSGAYLCDVSAQTITTEEVVKVGYTSGDNSYSVEALPFGLGTEGVA